MFKKRTQCLHHSFYVITNSSCFKWMTVITKTQIKNSSQNVRFADGSSGNTATNNKDNVQSPTKDSKNGQLTKRFTSFHKSACGVFRRHRAHWPPVPTHAPDAIRQGKEQTWYWLLAIPKSSMSLVKGLRPDGRLILIANPVEPSNIHLHLNSLQIVFR